MLLFFCGAGDEARTRYLHLGKVALYQMSYARKWCLRSESNQRHADFQSAALPTELQRHIKPLLQPDNGDHEGTRTSDPLLVRQVLSQLSYAPHSKPSYERQGLLY